MIRRPTTFVVGAGASKEFGLPVGEGLKNEIARLLPFEFEFNGRLKSGSPEVLSALRKISQQNSQYGDINQLIRAAWKIRDSMPLAPSIDNYLHTHDHDIHCNLVGKIAIAKIIVDHESSSDLYSEGADRGYKDDLQFDFERVKGSWLVKLWRILSEDIKLSHLNTMFEGVKFIVFNYDRCIEYFFWNALQIYFGINARQAEEIIEKIEIYHPYGQIAPLPWQVGGPNRISFGQKGSDAASFYQNIRTFTEQIEDVILLDRIRSAVLEAETLVFLGFAFHKMNLSLIRSDQKHRSKRIIATGLGLSQDAAYNIENDLVAFKASAEYATSLRTDLTCAQLIDEYYRSLSAR